jgi:PAS domain S-box-containing protein
MTQHGSSREAPAPAQAADTAGPGSAWTWIPVTLLAAALLGLWIAPETEPLEPRYLVTVLNATFTTLTSLLVAVLTARSYLRGGPTALLAIGGGMLLLGLASFVAGLIIPRQRHDAGVTIYNLALMIAGLLNLLGGLWLHRARPSALASPSLTLVLSLYGLAVLLLALIFTTIEHIPTFFDQAEGPTPVRQAVLAIAAILFAGAAALVLVLSSRLRSEFLRWYGLGLASIAVGVTGLMGIEVVGSAMGWAARAAQYLGGIYMLVGSILAMRQARGWLIPLRTLQETHRRYALLVDICPDAVLVHSRERIVFANPAAAQLLGVASPQELLGRSILDIVPEDWRQVVRTRIEWMNAGNTMAPVESRLLRQDGSVIEVEVAGAKAEFEGRPAIQVVFRDISVRKAAERAERESAARLRETLESIQEGFFSVDRDFVFTYVNAAGEAIFRRRRDELIGRPLFDAFPEARGSRFQAEYERAMREHLPARFEEHYPVYDGWYEIAAYPSDSGLSVFMHDITQRKRAEQVSRESEQRVRAALEEAKQANAAKDQFLAVLSHELRTPLNPALIAATLLGRDPALPEHLREHVETVRRNVELEATLIDDLLDLNRIARGKLQLNRQPVDARQIVRHAVDICHGEAESKSIDLSVTLPDEPVTVYADAARMQQVIWNLLKNAIKFTPAGGRVRVAAERADAAAARIQVIDSGAGIAPAMLQRVFNAFEQGGKQVTRRFGGMGLGLAICRGLVEMHEGQIRADSAGLGLGAIFTVELPLVVIARPRVGRGTPTEVKPMPEARLRGHILLVEDHESTARITALLLKGAGHSVELASSVESAKEAFARDRFDLVISDLGLPDGNGHELMRFLQSRRAVRGIALSGYGMETDIRASVEAGFNEHLVKPVNPRRLEDTIQQVLATPLVSSPPEDPASRDRPAEPLDA